jgi:hypothetical protein
MIFPPLMTQEPISFLRNGVSWIQSMTTSDLCYCKEIRLLCIKKALMKSREWRKKIYWKKSMMGAKFRQTGNPPGTMNCPPCAALAKQCLAGIAQ